MWLLSWLEYICPITGTNELIKAQVLFFLKALKQHEDMLIYLNLYFKFVSSMNSKLTHLVNLYKWSWRPQVGSFVRS